jgi:FkbM family methyltransferase
MRLALRERVIPASNSVDAPTMANDLVYDIGMHSGNDTAFYLACGFRVLAVEADPALVGTAKRRFEAEIESEKLVILNVGLAEHAATSEFWINELRPALNSFNRALTARCGEPHHSILIPCRRLDEILSMYGTPHYMKIDIEGHDIVCCDQLSPGNKPQYISVEMSRIELLLKLRDLGYDRFKLVNQHDLLPVGSHDIEPHVQALRFMYRFANHGIEQRQLSRRLGRASAAMILQLASALGVWGATKPFRSNRLPQWNFAEGGVVGTYSGTFGEDLPGEWLTWEKIAYLWHRDLREYQKMGLEFSCDLHASASQAKSPTHA